MDQNERNFQFKKLIRLLKFVVAVYILSWWVNCGSATDAPHNELLLLKVIGQHKGDENREELCNKYFLVFARRVNVETIMCGYSSNFLLTTKSFG